MVTSKICGIVALDLQSYGRASLARQRFLRRALDDILETALDQSTLSRQSFTLQDRGDGYLLVGDASLDLVHVGNLIMRDLRAGFNAAEIRGRASLHLGLVEPSGTGWAGKDVVLACRIADASSLKDVLADNDLEFLAIAFSERWKSEVIDIHPERCGNPKLQPIDVKEKEVNVEAYLWLTSNMQEFRSNSVPDNTQDHSPSFVFNGPVTADKVIGRDDCSSNYFNADGSGGDSGS